LRNCSQDRKAGTIESRMVVAAEAAGVTEAVEEAEEVVDIMVEEAVEAGAEEEEVVVAEVVVENGENWHIRM
jgi:hypothetical protein